MRVVVVLFVSDYSVMVVFLAAPVLSGEAIFVFSFVAYCILRVVAPGML